MPSLDDLRTALFDQLKRVQDPKEKFDAARTRAVTDIAGRLLDTARIEIDYARTTKKTMPSGFIGHLDAPTPKVDEPALLPGGPVSTSTAHGTKTVDGNITTHKLKG